MFIITHKSRENSNKGNNQLGCFSISFSALVLKIEFSKCTIYIVRLTNYHNVDLLNLNIFLRLVNKDALVSDELEM